MIAPHADQQVGEEAAEQGRIILDRRLKSGGRGLLQAFQVRRQPYTVYQQPVIVDFEGPQPVPVRDGEFGEVPAVVDGGQPLVFRIDEVQYDMIAAGQPVAMRPEPRDRVRLDDHPEIVVGPLVRLVRQARHRSRRHQSQHARIAFQGARQCLGESCIVSRVHTR